MDVHYQLRSVLSRVYPRAVGPNSARDGLRGEEIVCRTHSKALKHPLKLSRKLDQYSSCCERHGTSYDKVSVSASVGM